ncbi:FtsQ-type POTRA domain-containing protein [Microbacterium indicum]|uniref:FtsQ-type POTRA domain-containing protein n=1 Tax=Microbacterium indicum TaxID=358100 RepID=UPI00048CD5EA|nr:FtsQ-type POTRA domain-containing protein [Microbacterium indicum]
MKRPEPLPPAARRPEPEADESGLEPIADEPAARRGLASLLPFGRPRAEDPEPGDEPDGPLDDPESEAEPEVADGGLLGAWRAERRRRRLERSEVRRFTARARRRRIVWICSIGAVVVLVAGTVGAAYSPLFAVETITIEGASALDASAVEDALSDQVGRPMPLVDHSEIKADLVAFPLIETYAVEIRPPHDLVVRIVERTPVAVVQSDAGFTTVDAAGVALSTSDQRPDGLPLADVEGGPSSDAFAAAGQVLRALPADLLARVTTVHATTPDDVSFDLSDGGGVTVRWGSTEDTAEKLATLEAGMTASPPDTVSFYDVSSSGVLVVG